MRELLAISLLSILGGCSGQHPSRMIQLCLGDEQGVAAFKDAMRSVARAKDMEFVDGSASTEKDLSTLGQHPGYELIYIGVSGKNGIGLEAGNLGLSAHEVAIGFSEGTDKARAQEFEDAVIQALDRRWQVHAVPPNQGALSLESCSARRPGVDLQVPRTLGARGPPGPRRNVPPTSTSPVRIRRANCSSV